MPQLDFATYFNQIFFLFLIFGVFYIILFNFLRQNAKIFFYRFLSFNKKKMFVISLFNKYNLLSILLKNIHVFGLYLLSLNFKVIDSVLLFFFSDWKQENLLITSMYLNVVSLKFSNNKNTVLNTIFVDLN